ncbi:hypothetical protein TNCV_3548861 [Trichonephila clavipes]|nr:hypothetical protein TNCV_3548861 [Trichonephila clavipes]
MKIRAEIFEFHYFSEESEFNIYGSDGHQKVWRKANAPLKRNNRRGTVKTRWWFDYGLGCMAGNGKEELAFLLPVFTTVAFSLSLASVPFAQTDHLIGTSAYAPQSPMVAYTGMDTVVPGPHGLLRH